MHDDPRIYDLETGGFAADLPYWERLVDERRPARILDLACGTGRITLPLAQAGLHNRPDCRVVGLDISAPLLAQAEARLAEAEPRLREAVRFVHGDMRAFALDERFDLIVLGFNSFAYIYEQADQLSCLRTIRRHLAAGGRFAIDLLVPQLRFLEEASHPAPALRQEIDLAAPTAGIARFLRFAIERYDPAGQRDDTTYYYEIYHRDGRQERFTDDLGWQMVFPRELELLLAAADLVPVERWGSYARAPFGRRSALYLWVMAAVGDNA